VLLSRWWVLLGRAAGAVGAPVSGTRERATRTTQAPAAGRLVDVAIVEPSIVATYGTYNDISIHIKVIDHCCWG
jgi:hypothetical protein